MILAAPKDTRAPTRRDPTRQVLSVMYWPNPDKPHMFDRSISAHDFALFEDFGFYLTQNTYYKHAYPVDADYIRACIAEFPPSAQEAA